MPSKRKSTALFIKSHSLLLALIFVIFKTVTVNKSSTTQQAKVTKNTPFRKPSSTPNKNLSGRFSDQQGFQFSKLNSNKLQMQISKPHSLKETHKPQPPIIGNESPHGSYIKLIQQWAQCATPSPSCPFSDTDPKSFHIEKSKNISQLIKSFARKIDSSTPTHNAREIFEASIRLNDSFINDALLEVSRKVRRSPIIQKYLFYIATTETSPPIVEQAFLELVRTSKTPSDIWAVKAAYSRVVQSGPLHAANQLAKLGRLLHVNKATNLKTSLQKLRHLNSGEIF